MRPRPASTEDAASQRPARAAGRWLAGLIVLLAALPIWAAGDHPPPRIALIIDDLGYDLQAGRAALALPGALTYAVLPRAPYSRTLAGDVHTAGKELMLHQPMQSVAERRLDDGALTLNMDEQQFDRVLRQNLAALPFVRGVNNHMGSLLTRHPGHMAWLMRVLKARGDLFFVDSRTTAKTVAEQLATEYQIPNARRDVFLDDDPDPEAIEAQWRRLLRLARRHGGAIGIGHPHPATLKVVREQLSLLDERGIELVPASALVSRPIREPGNEKRRLNPWQASLSP